MEKFTFSKEQLIEYKEKLHKKLFWLILYKDPKTKDDYEYVDFDTYFNVLMKELSGFNELLSYPVEMVSILSLLQSAHNETKKDEFNWSMYRRLVLNAHNLVDKIGGR